MIELDVGQDRRVGKVVEELRPLVEEGSVVLIALQQKRPRAGLCGRLHLEAGAEIFSYPAD